MKSKSLHKMLLTTVAALSFFSFVFVNGHAYCNFGKPLTKTELLEKQIAKEEEEEKPSNIRLPDVTVLEKLLKLAHRFVPGSN